MSELAERAFDLLLSPALWFSAALALLVSLAFTAWRGGSPGQLVRDILAGMIGFGLGQLAGTLLGLDLLRVGQVYVLWGLLGAAASLMLGRTLWQRWQVRSRPSARR